ncbi:MAG: hypothetical protein R3B47_05220 [Bacteroidia bacterium]
MSESEQLQFRHFVACPLYNSRERLILLLDALLHFSPEFDQKALSYRQVFPRIFPNKDFDPQPLRTLMGELYALLKQFWAHQQLDQRSELSGLLTLQAMRKRPGKAAHFEAEVRRVHKQLTTSPLRDPDHYYHRYLLADVQNSWYASQLVRSYDPSLQEKMDALDAFYFTVKMGDGAEALSRNVILNAQYALHFMEELCELYDGNDAHFPAATGLYRQLLRCQEEPSEKRHYDRFVKMLFIQVPRFSREEARALFKTAQNYCIRRINLGETAFQEELFTLYQNLLDRALIFDENGQLDHTDFKNMCTLGLRQKAFGWVANLMEQQASRISEQHRSNVYNYCMALYETERGEQGKAIRLLAGVEFTDTLYDLSARRLMAQCYFEQEDWEGLEHHLNAFGLFLRRKKDLSTENKHSHLNFIKLLKNLGRLKEQAAWLPSQQVSSRLTSLNKRIEQTEPLAYRSWLRQKVELQGS